jgi:hypothetical protein
MTGATAPAPNAAMGGHWNGRAGETWVELERLAEPAAVHPQLGAHHHG